MEVKFDTSDRLGKVEKIIRVYTNDPAESVVKLKISAEIVIK